MGSGRLGYELKLEPLTVNTEEYQRVEITFFMPVKLCSKIIRYSAGGKGPRGS
jgi:hypothetical protein